MRLAQRLAEELDLAAQRLRQAGQHPKQRGLAAAVASDQRHTLARFEDEFGVVEQRNVAKGERSVGQDQVRHGQRSLKKGQRANRWQSSTPSDSGKARDSTAPVVRRPDAPRIVGRIP